MIVDKFNQFADGVALNTGAAASYLIGDQIDLGSAGIDLGHADQLYLVIKVTTAITAAATGTLSFTLASDAAAALTPASASKHLTTPVFDAAAGIAANTILYAGKLPFAGSVPYERYLGILQNTGVAAITAGAVDAFLCKDLAAYKAYPNAAGA